MNYPISFIISRFNLRSIIEESDLYSRGMSISHQLVIEIVPEHFESIANFFSEITREAEDGAAMRADKHDVLHLERFYPHDLFYLDVVFVNLLHTLWTYRHLYRYVMTNNKNFSELDTNVIQ
jgi:hypothetical protein